MIVSFFDKDGQKLEYGDFSLITKSLYRAIIDAESITGFKLKRISFNWATMQAGNKHLLVSACDFEHKVKLLKGM